MVKPLRLGLATLMGVGGLFGCSQAGPTTAPAQTGERTVLSTTETVSPDKFFTNDGKLIVDGKPMAFEDVTAQLPKQISEKDAAKMLVRINQEDVRLQGNYSVLRGGGGRGGGGRGGHGGRGVGFGGRGIGFSSFGGWGGFYGLGYYPGYAGYASSLYYPFGGYYFPYTYAGGFYSPVTGFGGYAPFYAGYSSLYYPFYRYW